MSSYFYAKDIIHQKSCVVTPQQSGIVERTYRHLLEVACACVPSTFTSLILGWFFANSNLYNKQVAYSCSVQQISQWTFVFSNTKLFSFRFFGYLLYASTLTVIRSKFNSRARKCIFLGYLFGVKGYK